MQNENQDMLKEYPIPKGFRKIFKNFAREVLRSQPQDILTFGAHYFKVISAGIDWVQESEYKRFIDTGEPVPKNVMFPSDVHDKYAHYR